MSTMVKRAIDIVDKKGFIAIYDKGYHTGEEIWACHQMGIETLVAVPN
jgi:vancomycin permeability regulator SanA